MTTLTIVRECIRDLVQQRIEELKRVRETHVSDGSRVPHGSPRHIEDLEARIADLTRWRDRQRRGSEARANYARLLNKLRAELASARRANDRLKSVHESVDILREVNYPNVEAYESLLTDLGFDLISTPRQLKNQTYVWNNGDLDRKFFIYHPDVDQVRVGTVGNKTHHDIQSVIARGSLSPTQVIDAIKKYRNKILDTRTTRLMQAGTTWVLRPGKDVLPIKLFGTPGGDELLGHVDINSLLVVGDKLQQVGDTDWFPVELDDMPGWIEGRWMTPTFWKPIAPGKRPPKKNRVKYQFRVHVYYRHDASKNERGPLEQDVKDGFDDILLGTAEELFGHSNVSLTKIDHDQGASWSYYAEYVLSFKTHAPRNQLESWQDDVARRLADEVEAANQPRPLVNIYES